MRKDLEITENLEAFLETPVMRGHPVLWGDMIIEDQPYIVDTTMRNFKLHQIQMCLHGIAIGLRIPVHRVSPRKARTDLGICSGNYSLNKTLSIEYCAQKLGAEFTEQPANLRNHVADTVMLAFWLISKKLGLNIDDTTQNSVWVPPKRWTNVAPLRGLGSPPPPPQKRRGRPAKKTLSNEPSEQVREHERQGEQTGRGSGDLGVQDRLDTLSNDSSRNRTGDIHVINIENDRVCHINRSPDHASNADSWRAQP